MNDEQDFDLGMNVITITIREGQDAPDIDLGGVSPMVAFGALAAAQQTVNLIIPHCDISTNGRQILSVMDLTDDED